MSVYKITFDSEQDGFYLEDLVEYVNGLTGLKEAFKNFRWAYKDRGEAIFVTSVEKLSMEDVITILRKKDAKCC